jgi:hypothetical protein
MVSAISTRLLMLGWGSVGGVIVSKEYFLSKNINEKNVIRNNNMSQYKLFKVLTWYLKGQYHYTCQHYNLQNQVLK